MKIIFTADTHFGSAFRGENTSVRNGELISAFRSMCRYALDGGAKAVLMGGDIFDTPYPSHELQASFISVLKEFEVLKFIMIAGNHDPLYECAVYSHLPANAYVFPAELTAYEFDGLRIYGASVSQAGDTRDPFVNLRCDSRDVILTHGMLDGTAEFSLNSRTLADTGSKLILSGHVHAGFDKLLTSGAQFIYSGAPWGRGFDECGEKGFYEIDTDTFETKFITSQAKIYKEYSVDVSQTASVEELYEVIGGVTTGKNEISRLILKGNMAHPYNIESDVIAGFFPQFVSIKDKTEVDVTSFENVAENTLEGKFIRILQAKLENEADENEKTKIYDAIKQGLIAMRNR